MRKLASIQKVLNVRPIPGADVIEVVDVLGWSVVVKKEDNLKINDLVVYYEVDSFLSDQDPRYNVPAFQERFINWGEKRGMRLKTIRLRKQISQGLVLPLSSFPEITPDLQAEGTDVTELLKIERWESLVEERGNKGGMGQKTAGANRFPSFLKKTDQERVQNYIFELPKHLAEDFEVTVKLDGSSMTVFHVGKNSPHFGYAWEDIETRMLRNKSWFGKMWYKLKKWLKIEPVPHFVDGVCSRNLQLDTGGNNHFSEYVRKHFLLEKLAEFDENIALQGELIAPSIQENYEQVKDFEFYVFDIFNIDKQEYVLPPMRRAYLNALGIQGVPVLFEEKSLTDFFVFTPEGEQDQRATVEKILDFAEGPGMNKGVKREGVVFKSNKQDFSFKAISNSYLLKKKD